MPQDLVQGNVSDAIRELIVEVKESKYSGGLLITFQDGNLVNVTRREEISAEKILKKYVPKLRKTIVIRTKKESEESGKDE